jgi:hypothetical protein
MLEKLAQLKIDEQPASDETNPLWAGLNKLKNLN